MGYFDYDEEDFGFFKQFKKAKKHKSNESFEDDQKWYGFNNYSKYYNFNRAELSALHTDFGAVKFNDGEKNIIGSSVNTMYNRLKQQYGDEKINSIKDSLDVIIPDILSSFYSIDKEYDVNKYNKDWVDILCKLDFKSYGFLTKGNFYFSEKFTSIAVDAITSELLKNSDAPKQAGCDFKNKQEQKQNDSANKQQGDKSDESDSQEDQTQEDQGSGNQSGQPGNDSVQQSKNLMAERVSNALDHFSSTSEVTKMLNAKNLVDQVNKFSNKDEETDNDVMMEDGHEASSDKGDKKDDEFDSSFIDAQKDLFEYVMENYDLFNKKSSFSKLINKTLVSTKNAFIPSIKRHEESLFEAESINGIEDYIYLIDPLDCMITELKTLDTQKSLKFDIYIDISGSMTDSMIDQNGQSKEKYSFAKQYTYRLYKENMIGNLYSFNNEVNPSSVKGILYNNFDGGTTMRKVFDNILKTKRPSMILTDAEDNCKMASVYNEKDLKTIVDNTFVAVLVDCSKRVGQSNKDLIFYNPSCTNFEPLIKNKRYAYINTRNSKLYKAVKIQENSDDQVLAKEL